MKIVMRLLILLLTVELVVSAWLLGSRWSSPAPPVTDLSGFDDLTRSEIELLSRLAATGHAREWTQLGEAYLSIGYFPVAEQCFRRAVALDPRSDQALYELGFSLERMGRVTEAIPILERAAGTGDPELAATCQYQIGRCWLRQERLKEAEAVFRKAISHPASRYQLAKLLVQQERADEALPVIAAGLGGIPDELKLIQLKARAYEQLGRVPEAERLRDDAERAKAQLTLEYSLSFTGMLRSRLGLGRLQGRSAMLEPSGPLEQRVAASQAILELIRRNEMWYFVKPYVSAARQALEMGQPQQALQLLDEVESHNESIPEGLELRGDALVLTGQEPAGFQLWERANKLRPSSPLHLKLGEMERAQGNATRQKQHLSAAAELRGVAAFRDNDLAAAAGELQQAIEFSAENVRAWYYIGEVHRVQGDVAAARSAYDRCLQIDGNYYRAKSRLDRLAQAT